MTGVITPFVEGRRIKTWTAALSLFALGAATGAFVTGLLLAGLGSLVQRDMDGATAVAAGIGLVGIFLAAADLGLGPIRTPSLRRQTPSWWLQVLGPRRTWLLWGIDLGLGFSTIRVSSLFWLVALAAVFLIPPIAAPVVLAAYGLALALGLSAMVLTALTQKSQRRLGTSLAMSRARVKMTSGVVVLAFSAAMLASSVAAYAGG